MPIIGNKMSVADLAGNTWQALVDGSNIELHVCDISSMAAVRALCDAYVNSGRPLNVLVNNAGCMVHERTQTPEQVEVGPGGYCSPRHQKHFEPSTLELDDTL